MISVFRNSVSFFLSFSQKGKLWQNVLSCKVSGEARLNLSSHFQEQGAHKTGFFPALTHRSCNHFRLPVLCLLLWRWFELGNSCKLIGKYLCLGSMIFLRSLPSPEAPQGYGKIAGKPVTVEYGNSCINTSMVLHYLLVTANAVDSLLCHHHSCHYHSRIL